MIKEFIPTIEDVLKRPLFQHAKIVAGKKGVARKISWAHILEIPDGAIFINGGELILSTGIGFGEDCTKQVDYLFKLIEKKAAGLCIELGPFVPKIPQEMIELADRHHFPLIAFHRPVQFVDITKDLHENIVNQHTQAIRDLSSYAHDLQRLTLENQSLTKVLNYFHTYSKKQTFFCELGRTTIFTPEASEMVMDKVTNFLHSSLENRECPLQNVDVFYLSDEKKMVFQKIKALGHVLAYVGVILDESEPEDILHLTLDYTASAMAQLLLRRMFIEERSNDAQQRLFDDILENHFKDEQQVRTALSINQKNKTVPHYLTLILEIDQQKVYVEQQNESPFHDLIVVLRLVLARLGFRVIVRNKGSRLYMLLIENKPCLENRDFIKKVIKEIERSYKHACGESDSLKIGVGRKSRQYVEVSLHFKEAEQVLHFSSERSSPFFEDLGVYRILTEVKNEYVLSSFITDYLGELIEYDEKHNSQLVLTLNVLFQCNGSKKEAADRLFIRRQSLYHRLDKIESILGNTYLTSNHRLCLELALRAYDWTSKK